MADPTRPRSGPQHRLDLSAPAVLDLAAQLRQLAATLETIVATTGEMPAGADDPEDIGKL